MSVRESRGVEGVGGWADDGLSTVAEEAAGEKLGFELWLVSFHSVGGEYVRERKLCYRYFGD